MSECSILRDEYFDMLEFSWIIGGEITPHFHFLGADDVISSRQSTGQWRRRDHLEGGGGSLRDHHDCGQLDYGRLVPKGREASPHLVRCVLGAAMVHPVIG